MYFVSGFRVLSPRQFASNARGMTEHHGGGSVWWRTVYHLGSREGESQGVDP